MPHRLCIPCACNGIEAVAVAQRALFTYPDQSEDLVWLCQVHTDQYDCAILADKRREAQRIAARLRGELP